MRQYEQKTWHYEQWIVKKKLSNLGARERVVILNVFENKDWRGCMIRVFKEA